MALRLFCISMADATARRSAAAAQLHSVGVDFEFFDGVGGAEALACFSGCNEYNWILSTGRTVTPGELGCYASHRTIWQRCVELGEPIIVMEDDFLLLPGFAEAVEQLVAHIERCGFIRLQTETRARSRRQQRCGTLELVRYTKAPHSTNCYGLAPAAAARFLEKSAVAREPVDVFIKKFWVHGQPLYGLKPYTVTESTLSDASNISGRRKTPKDLPTALRRLLMKCDWVIRRTLFNFRTR